MSKSILQFEPEYDFGIIAISSHQKDYRLCWFLNRDLKIQMERGKDLELIQNNESAYFSCFHFSDEVIDVHYSLIENFSGSTLFLSEVKQADFFFKISGETNVQLESTLLSQIKNCEVVQTAFKLEPEQLKYASKFLYE